MKIYVIGPVTGIPNDNKEAFVQACHDLVEAGYLAAIPHYFIPSDAEWHEAMKVSIAQMMQADGVAMLDGWHDSKGACLEYDIARRVGMPAYCVDHWISSAAHYLKGM
ncbi:MAG: DUF4406 domain-containing protein [Eggerthellaceae bacterium]|nr:DUF4406 domain-containing protein [Eggerthellaceae bacterium]